MANYIDRVLIPLQRLYDKREALAARIINTEKRLADEVRKSNEPPKKRGRKPAA